MKVRAVVNYFNRIYPFKTAAPGDRVGLQLGDASWEVRGITAALDLTNDVLRAAKKHNANLIITHHPFLFNDEWAADVKESPYKGRLFAALQKSQIAVLTLHTNYDKTNKQMATIIANRLGLPPRASRSNYGHLFTQQVTKAQLALLFQERLGLKILRSTLSPEVSYQKWWLLPGAGAPAEIALLHAEGAKFIVTSDIKWSTWTTAKNDHFALAEVSHAIEDLFTDDIFLTIKKQWKTARVFKKVVLG